ncbi:MAG TPA: hypothetical protein VKU02_26165, partial [Gemmataceae bacterium]|nr:hypothetical protein [Gemmataceae bacterium]
TNGAQTVLVTGGGTSTGGNSSTTLNDSGLFALWHPNQFVGVPVQITSGTGVGQTRTVSSNTANQLTISSSWDIIPDATSTFRIGYINGPNVLVYKGGFLYVATEALADGTVHSLVRVDPVSGTQTLITDGNNGPHFSIAVGMGLPPNNSDPNDVYVGDEPGNVQGSDPGKVWKVNIINGQQTIVSQNGSQGNLFNHPVDLTVESSGTILVVNTGTNGFNGSVIRIDPITGNQSLVTSFSGGTNGGLDSIDVGNGPFGSGTIFVGAISYSSVDARIYAADPASMTTNPPVLTSDTLMSEVEGIRVFHAPVQGNNPPSVTPPSNQSANEGTLQNINLGSFSDQNPGTWTATINWGDGTSNSTFNPNAPGTLGTQPHTFGEEGTYTVTITVINNSDHLSGSGMFMVTVSDLNVVAMAANVNPTAGGPYTGPVATFTDPGGPEANDGTHYSASINWGDNSAPTTGSITLVNGVFTVSGVHTYAAANTYNIMVTINHELTTTPLSEMVSVTNLGQFVQPGLIKPISFWAGLQGQELLRRFGLTASGQTLGQWLATTYPNLYGGGNGAPNLSPFTNAQISSYYLSLFLVSKGTGLDAEVLATALEVFTTTLSLGGTTGQANGFTVNSNGLGAYSWNVGSSGPAFGVPSNTILNVYQILLDTNNSAVGGEPWGTNTLFRNEGLAVYMGINSV